MEALVTVITPMHDSEAYISESINSVLNQSYKNWELILIDDYSQDKTLKIIQPLIEPYSNIKLFKNSKNLGAAISRNRGIEAAKGDYIAFLDADDLWKPNKLEVQIEFMKTHDCDVCFSSYDFIDVLGNSLDKTSHALKELSYNKLLKSNYIGNLTGVYHAKRLGKIASPNLRKRQDWLLWLTAIKKSGKPALGISESLAYYRVRDDSMSSNKLELIKHNYWVYQKGLGFSKLKSYYWMLVFLKEHFLVKSKQIRSTKKR
ncbi:glycosyltransferase family 2 protein [Tamlana sp. 2_MG-2023]|uniref:glycosyltransferase family 2 protein n=1 Tax=unclassified Tamlana TaxID=2614803 RepID=UPI0026E2CE8E|nr:MULTISPECIES: glycosyltransferase family 2 protein [unclassified Tamlana]MDO6759760.1 glycosyltransferase family 2 protein [Tamlana sp. 2_MG-2023]MDO6791383.1 glycosyltransferase family 2 protein [Tamlana sp. 1_MG-2023]